MTFVTENMRPMPEDTTKDPYTGVDIWIAKENPIIFYRMFETRIHPHYLLSTLQTFDVEQNRWEQTILDITNDIPTWFGSPNVSWYTYDSRERVLHLQYYGRGCIENKIGSRHSGTHNAAVVFSDGIDSGKHNLFRCR